MNARHRIGFAAATVAALASAACNKPSQPMDAGLKQDLAAAKTSAASNLSISPLELGERSAPATRQAPRAVKHAPQAVAPKSVVAQAPPVQAAQQPAPAPEVQTPAPQHAEQPAPAAAKPAPAPIRGSGDEHHGRYKTEAEIFRQMPWIRP